MLNIKNKITINDFFSLLIILLMLFGNFLFGDDGYKYFSGLLMIVILFQRGFDFFSVKEVAGLIFIFSMMYVLLIVNHLGDVKTVISVVSIFVMFLGAIAFAYSYVDKYGHKKAIERFFLHILILLPISFALSTAFTAIHHVNAPSLYFWQQLLLGERLKVMSPDFTGHSSLITISSLILILSLCCLSSIRHKFFLSLAMSALLYWSGTRTGSLIVIMVFSFYCIFSFSNSYKLAALFLFTIPLFFLFATLRPEVINEILSEIDYGLIQPLGFDSIMRVSGDFSTGRQALNEYMIGLIGKSPIFGLGNSSEYFLFSISVDGFVTEEGASSESFFRIAAKHGLLYCLLLFAYLTYPVFLARSACNRVLQLMSILLFVFVLVLLMNGGIFENFFGDSWLILVFMNLLVFNLISSKGKLLCE